MQDHSKTSKERKERKSNKAKKTRKTRKDNWMTLKLLTGRMMSDCTERN